MTLRALEKELLRQTFQIFTSTTQLGTEILKTSDYYRQGQPPLKHYVIDLAKRYYPSVATQ